MVRTCRPCSNATSRDGDASEDRQRSRPNLACACGDEVPLHMARPVVSAAGGVEMFCPVCAAATPAERQARIAGEDDAGLASVPPTAEHPRPGARSRWVRWAMAAMSTAACILVWWHVRAEKPASAAATVEGAYVADSARPRVLTGMLAVGPAAWDVDLGPTREDELEGEGEPLDYEYPTLQDWVHPVPGVALTVPANRSRRFGAERPNVNRTECGAGHCGVDLMGPRGQPVVAVAWGVIVRVEYNPNRRSGKFVRIEHPEYVYTSYMHLDDIAPGIEVGREIAAGEVVGSLGRSGIHHSAAHLHFSLEIPDGERTRYIDPSPYLAEASVLETFAYQGSPRSRGAQPARRDIPDITDDDEDGDPGDGVLEDDGADEVEDDGADSGDGDGDGLARAGDDRGAGGSSARDGAGVPGGRPSVGHDTGARSRPPARSKPAPGDQPARPATGEAAGADADPDRSAAVSDPGAGAGGSAL